MNAVLHKHTTQNKTQLFCTVDITWKSTDIVYYFCDKNPSVNSQLGSYKMANIKFLGLQMEYHLNWKNHIELIIPKLCGAFYAVQSMAHIGDITRLKTISFAYFHSIMKYGIIFWVTLPAVQRYSL
jgi:hypothetical protein